ncbi:MAG: hypothetical protein AAB802_05150, partial [Patescibacteria group bacterium]
MADQAISQMKATVYVKPDPVAPQGTVPAAPAAAPAPVQAAAPVAAPAPVKPVAKAAEKAAATKLATEERKKLLEAEKLYQEGIASIRDLIAPSSFEIGYDHFKLDGFFAQTFFVYTYPRYIDTNWMTPVVNFDVTMDISQFIYPISSEQIMKTLKTKVAQLQSSIRMSAEKGNVRDPALETALEDA